MICSDWTRLAALELLVGALGLYYERVLDCPFLLLNLIAEALVPQVHYSPQATQDFFVQLETICDSVLYTYLSKVANTAEKRQYLHVSCTAVNDLHPRDLGELDRFLNDLHESRIFDLHHSEIFRPFDLRVLIFLMSTWTGLRRYFWKFRSDPKRSKEFHYEHALCHAFLATRYMRFLRTLSNSRYGTLSKYSPTSSEL